MHFTLLDICAVIVTVIAVLFCFNVVPF